MRSAARAHASPSIARRASSSSKGPTPWIAAGTAYRNWARRESEQFALILVRHFLAMYPQVSAALIELTQASWQRIAIGGLLLAFIILQRFLSRAAAQSR